MKVYVAGSTKEVERVKKTQDIIRKKGWTITFDWTGADGEIRTDGSWDENSPKGEDISLKEIKACKEADLIILLAPKVSSGLGCWIEVGAGLASGTKVWVVEPMKDSVFWQHPQVARIASDDELHTRLIKEYDNG